MTLFYWSSRKLQKFWRYSKSYCSSSFRQPSLMHEAFHCVQMRSCVSPPPTVTTWCCRSLPPRPCCGATRPRGRRSTSRCRGRRGRRPQRWRMETVEWDLDANSIIHVEEPHNPLTPRFTRSLSASPTIVFEHYTIKQDQSKLTLSYTSLFLSFKSRRNVEFWSFWSISVPTDSAFVNIYKGQNERRKV